MELIIGCFFHGSSRSSHGSNNFTSVDTLMSSSVGDWLFDDEAICYTHVFFQRQGDFLSSYIYFQSIHDILHKTIPFQNSIQLKSPQNCSFVRVAISQKRIKSSVS